jgi:polyketide cyclase/dehydrase/lipid transport protein
MWKKILLAVVAIFVVFAIIVAMQPADFKIERSATMHAKSASPFAQVNDFHNWQNWSPWAKIDPQMKTTFEGPASGTGAMYKWSGNDKVGQGEMKITDSHPDDRVTIDLQFLKPFPANNTALFSFKPEGDQTVVTWTMTGHNGFMAKAFGLFVNIDKMVGDDFERGLDQMKATVETPPAKSPPEKAPQHKPEA